MLKNILHFRKGYDMHRFGPPPFIMQLPKV